MLLHGDRLYSCKIRTRNGEVSYIVLAENLHLETSIVRGGNAGFPVHTTLSNIQQGATIFADKSFEIIDCIPLDRFS